MKKMFNDWNKFEIVFLIVGLILACLSTVVFQGTLINFIYTVLYFVTALLLAKGKYLAYIFGIMSVFFYAVVSYKNMYFGETVIAMTITCPLMIIGLVNWIKHTDDKFVKIKELTKFEIAAVMLSQVVMFFGYYYLLKYFNTNEVFFSSLSLVASVIATYFTARRSEYDFMFYIINDVILISLWLIPVVKGDLTLISVLVCPVLLLVNDIYAVYNWKKEKMNQNIELT